MELKDRIERDVWGVCIYVPSPGYSICCVPDICVYIHGHTTYMFIPLMGEQGHFYEGGGKKCKMSGPITGLENGDLWSGFPSSCMRRSVSS